MASEDPFRWVERSETSFRSSQEECAAAAAAAADQAKEEEIVARSGDSGDFVDAAELDPWASGKMEHMEMKWLEQRLRLSSRRMSGSQSSSRRISVSRLSDAGDRELGGVGARSGRSLNRGDLQLSDAEDRELGGVGARSGRSLNRSDLPIHEIGRGTDNAGSSMVDLSSYEINPDELQNVPFPVDALSPLSDKPFIRDSPEAARALDSQTSGAQSSSRDPHSVKANKFRHPLEYASTLAHLACFGIIGVLIRFGLEVLFSDKLGVTQDGTVLYIDLPANMVGSFFMGWVGIVLKRDISLFSEPLAIGLSTGLMGSITTFASWNLKMVNLMTRGRWAAAVTGYLIGMETSQMSLLIGVETANFLMWLIECIQHNRIKKGLKVISRPRPDSFHRRMVSLSIFFCLSGSLWVAAVVLTILDRSSQKLRTLWLACVVAPPGVWARWHLARLNGQGFGSHFKWLPIGTLLTNLIAASLDAALGIVQLAVKDDSAALLTGGLQLGFLGCMSTVSTFVAEVYTMHQGPMRSRAYAYMIGTLLSAFSLGILIYSSPAWAKGYVHW